MRDGAQNDDLGMVRWPSPYAPFKDSGEGGLFAYAVWGEQPARCFVDWSPFFPMWDVMVAAHGPLAEVLRAEDKHYDEHVNKLVQSGRLTDFSIGVSISSVLFLGSTPHSLFHEGEGEYFSVKPSDITENAAEAINLLSGFYGDPSYVTFLDT